MLVDGSGEALLPEGWGTVMWTRKGRRPPSPQMAEVAEAVQSLQSILPPGTASPLSTFMDSQMHAEVIHRCIAHICPSCIDQLEISDFDVVGEV